MKTSLSAVVLLGLLAAGLAQAQQKSVVDFGDKTFKAADVVRALAPRPAATNAPEGATRGPKLNDAATTSRGVSLNKDYTPDAPAAATAAEAPQVASAPRKLSMRLQFALNSAELSPGAKRRLDAVGEALGTAELGNARFVISGHTDSTGSYDYNLRLSKRRADAVKLYLVSAHDVEPRRLKAVGRGPDDPLDEANPANPLNRRVQLEVVE